jgi:subtilisin family serine protease
MNVMKARVLAILFIFALPLALSFAQSGGEEYIVVLRPGQSIAALNKTHGTQTVRQIPNKPIYLLRPGDSTLFGIKKIKEDNRVELAEKNNRGRFSNSADVFVDRALAQQMASLLDGSTLTTFYGTTVLQAYVDQPAVRITQLNKARSLSTGAATRVAYIDTGVDFNHPALQPWLDPGIDLVLNRTASELDGLPDQPLLAQQMASLLDGRLSFILNQVMASLLDDDLNGSFPSAFGHGTLVAGIIHLFAPETRIVPIKAFDAYGNTTLFTIVEAIYRAKELDVDVLNMSFSTNENSDVLKKAISDLKQSGITVVASVGNDASDLKSLYPATYPHVIGVAATDFNDHLAIFSNYGTSVSIAAPGAYVVSTAPGGKYAAAWGTSFSAPIVAGTVALIASGLGHGQSDAKTVLKTADSIDNVNPSFKKQLGEGRINVQRAVASAKP